MSAQRVKTNISDRDTPIKYKSNIKKVNELMPFNELETAYIYRLDFDINSIPGTGVIVIDQSVFLGFDTTGMHKVDYGIFIRDCGDFSRQVERWFMKHVRDISSHNPLQDMRRNISLMQGMRALRVLSGC